MDSSLDDQAVMHYVLPHTASHCIDEAEVYTMHTVRELREFLSELQKEIPINAEEIKSTTVSQDSTQ